MSNNCRQYNIFVIRRLSVLQSLGQNIPMNAFGQLIEEPIETAPLVHRKKTGAKLVQQELALLCALDEVLINTYVVKPSRKLLQHCSAYKDRRKRTEILPEMSITMAENVQLRYERVIPHLKTDEGRKRAKQELEIVRKKIAETHFEK